VEAGRGSGSGGYSKRGKRKEFKKKNFSVQKRERFSSPDTQKYCGVRDRKSKRPMAGKVVYKRKRITGTGITKKVEGGEPVVDVLSLNAFGGAHC